MIPFKGTVPGLQMAAFLLCLYGVPYSFHEHTDSIIRAALSWPQLNLITSLHSHPQMPSCGCLELQLMNWGSSNIQSVRMAFLKCMLEEIFAKYKNLQTLKYFYQYCYMFYWQVLKLFPCSLVSKETTFFLSTVQKNKSLVQFGI